MTVLTTLGPSALSQELPNQSISAKKRSWGVGVGWDAEGTEWLVDPFGGKYCLTVTLWHLAKLAFHPSRDNTVEEKGEILLVHLSDSSWETKTKPIEVSSELGVVHTCNPGSGGAKRTRNFRPG